MNICAVCACTMGVAHTFIAKDKLVETATRLGHHIKCETQGSVGIECKITEEDLKDCDVVIIASDINISESERFKGHPTVKVPVTVAIKQPEQLLNKIEAQLSKKQEDKYEQAIFMDKIV